MRTVENDHRSAINQYIKEFEEKFRTPYDDKVYLHPNNVSQHLLEYVARIKFQQSVRDLYIAERNLPLATKIEGSHLSLLTEQGVENWKEAEAKMKLWQPYGHYSC